MSYHSDRQEFKWFWKPRNRNYKQKERERVSFGYRFSRGCISHFYGCLCKLFKRHPRFAVSSLFTDSDFECTAEGNGRLQWLETEKTPRRRVKACCSDIREPTNREMRYWIEGIEERVTSEWEEMTRNQMEGQNEPDLLLPCHQMDWKYRHTSNDERDFEEQNEAGNHMSNEERRNLGKRVS